jgi:hypothetical protein
VCISMLALECMQLLGTLRHNRRLLCAPCALSPADPCLHHILSFFWPIWMHLPTQGTPRPLPPVTPPLAPARSPPPSPVPNSMSTSSASAMMGIRRWDTGWTTFLPCRCLYL